MPLDLHARQLDADLILVGGGLANGLIAWRLAQLKPALRVLLLEHGNSLGGNHTWSFHDADLNAGQRAWVEPLVAHRWSHYSVNFPGRQRELESGYATLTSARFDAVLRPVLGARARLGQRVTALSPRSVTLSSGHTLQAGAVIDGRGVRPSPHLTLGFQKFLGQELRLSTPHGLRGPILMDACVPQQGGYHFVYTLPLAADRVLIEDTFYADGSGLDPRKLRANIADYARARGWVVAAVLREEQGVLPITLAGDNAAFWQEADGVPRAGLAAGLFNPATGYSLPDSVRLADLIAGLPDASLAATPLFRAVRAHAQARWREQGFFRLLNRMLFRAASPPERWRVLQRFYGLPLPLIQRFYAAQLRPLDKLRILSGKPPVALLPALQAAFSGAPRLVRRNIL